MRHLKNFGLTKKSLDACILPQAKEAVQVIQNFRTFWNLFKKAFGLFLKAKGNFMNKGKIILVDFLCLFRD